MIDFGDLREAGPFRDDQPRDLSPLGVEHVAFEDFKQAGKQSIKRRVYKFADLADSREHRLDRMEDDLLEQVVLILEEKVDRSFGDAGPRHDVIEPRSCEALAYEHVQRRLENRLPPRLGGKLALA